MRQLSAFLLLGTVFCTTASAQKWEIGGGVGCSFFTSESVKNAVTTGDASLANAISASFWLGNNSGHLLGGELRYDYENTKLMLTAAGTSANFGADTHALHYDFLLHLTPGESRIRPYVSGGGGIKLYRGTGTENSFQPLSSLALLTKATQVKPLISAGAGLKVQLIRALQLRIEVRDVLTPFPKTVIAPAQGSKLGGWLQDFVIMAGLSLTI